MPKRLQPLPPSVFPLPEEDFFRLRRIHGSAMWLDWHKKCETCGKKGTFKARCKGQIEEFICDCRDQHMLYMKLLNAGIDLRYQRLSWDDVTQVAEDVERATMSYLFNAEALVGSGLGLTLWSTVNGTGKTMLATLVLKGLIRDGYDCYSTLFGQMMDDWAAGWKDTDARQWFERRVINAGVLLIDDVGSERKRKRYAADGTPAHEALEAVETMFDRVVRMRYNASKPTLITTNLTPKLMEQGYGPSVLSLLSGVNQQIEVVGRDFRPSLGKDAHQDALDGIRSAIVLDTIA